MHTFKWARAPIPPHSGDDHDYCEYLHENNINGHPVQIKEASVKSFSMAVGIRQPCYQPLSLASPAHTPATFAARACLLPNQLGIYLDIYVPLIHIHCRTRPCEIPPWPMTKRVDIYLSSSSPSSSSSSSFTTHLRSLDAPPSRLIVRVKTKESL